MDTIDLFLISGFLGAGKTTFLKNILEKETSKRIGVIVNEFSDVGLDAASLKLPADADIPMMEINNGSIFCACIKGGFVKTLADFLEKPIDRLYVEASGMADPSSMESLLTEMVPFVQKKMNITRSYNYRGSICVVDAVNFEDLSSTFVAGYNQVMKSNLILLNKTDLASPEDIAELRTELAGINPTAFIYETTYAAVPDEILDRYLQGENAEIIDSSNTCDSRPFGGVLLVPDAIDEAAFTGFLKSIQEDFIRIKGTFRTKDGLRHAEGVGDLFSCEAVGEESEDVAGKVVIISAGDIDLTDLLREQWAEFFDTELPFKRER